MSFPIQGTTFVIYPITPQHRNAILEVYRQCEDFLALGPVAKASMEMVLEDLAHSRKEGGIFCGIFDSHSQQMLGVVDFVPAGYENDPASVYLELLMIAAPYRGRGLGCEIVQRVEAMIWEDAQVTRIQAGVQVNNTAARRFWHNRGYLETGPEQTLPDQTICVPLCKPRLEVDPHA